MYDTMWDVFVRKLGLNPSLCKKGKFQASYRPNLAAEILPLLSRPNLYQYVAKIGAFGAGRHAALPGETSQQFAANALPAIRPPGRPMPALGQMPKLAGDNPISVFSIVGFPDPDRNAVLHPRSVRQRHRLARLPRRRSAREARWTGPAWKAASAAFCPGIEMTWISATRRSTGRSPPIPLCQTHSASDTRISAAGSL
jgi:hypothetical protein